MGQLISKLRVLVYFMKEEILVERWIVDWICHNRYKLSENCKNENYKFFFYFFSWLWWIFSGFDSKLIYQISMKYWEFIDLKFKYFSRQESYCNKYFLSSKNVVKEFIWPIYIVNKCKYGAKKVHFRWLFSRVASIFVPIGFCSVLIVSGWCWAVNTK